MFRVECPFEVVVRNHKQPGWVIPANDGVMVPEYFLAFVARAGKQLPPDEDQEVRYRVDLYMPPTMFETVCRWIHTQPADTRKCCGLCTGQERIFFDHMTKHWNLPEQVGSISENGLDWLATWWNTNVAPNVVHFHGVLCTIFSEMTCQRGAPFTMQQINHALKLADAHHIDVKKLPQNFKRYFTSEHSVDFSMSSQREPSSPPSHCVACPLLYDIPEYILRTRDEILRLSSLWAAPSDSEWPKEMAVIANMIAVNKKVPLAEATKRCTSPLNENDEFWRDH